MPSKLPIITFRLSEEDNLKFKYIADAHNRKINDELKMLTLKHIADYESEHGKLVIGEEGNIIIAKPKEIKGKSSNSKIS